MIKELNSESNSVTVEVYDDSGLPVEGLDASTFPDVFYRRAAASTGQLALLTLATESAPWTDGGVKESAEGGGKYRLDLSNFLFTSAGDVTIWGEASGKHMLPVLLEVRESGLFAGDINDIIAGVADSLSDSELTLRSLFDGRSLTIYQGTEISSANGNAVDWDFTTLPDLSGGAARFDIVVPKGSVLLPVTLAIVNPGTATQTLRLTMTAAEATKLIPPNQYSGVILYKTFGATSYSVAREILVNARRA